MIRKHLLTDSHNAAMINVYKLKHGLILQIGMRLTHEIRYVVYGRPLLSEALPGCIIGKASKEHLWDTRHIKADLAERFDYRIMLKSSRDRDTTHCYGTPLFIIRSADRSMSNVANVRHYHGTY